MFCKEYELPIVLAHGIGGLDARHMIVRREAYKLFAEIDEGNNFASRTYARRAARSRAL